MEVKEGSNVKCETCGVVFYKTYNRYSRTKTNKHYCSAVCYRKNPVVTQEKTGKDISCDYCGSIVYKSGSQLLASKSGKHFCCKKCSSRYISDIVQSRHNTVCSNCGVSFRKSPSNISERNYCCRSCWKEGVKSNGPAYYRKFKGDQCEECGFIPEDACQLDIHHSDVNKKNNSIENLQTLCANCHRIVHKRLRDGTI